MTIIIGLFFVHARYKVPVVPRTRSMLEEFREGAQYLFKNSSVGLIVIIAATLGIFAFPIIQQLPVISTNILKQAGDTKSIIDLRNSMLYTAQGVGALIAAFSIAMNNTAALAWTTSHCRRGGLYSWDHRNWDYPIHYGLPS